MKLLTKYITPDDFLEYFGIDLGAELRGDANPSDKANAYLLRIENRMEAFLNAKFFKRVSDEWPCFTDYQKEHYKLALLEQAIYIFKNGDITVDSGYEPESGIIASKHALRELSIAPNAIDELRLTGLWNANIDNRKGIWGIWGL